MEEEDPVPANKMTLRLSSVQDENRSFFRGCLRMLRR